MGSYVGKTDIGTGLKIEGDKLILDFIADSGLALDGNSLTLDKTKLEELLELNDLKIVSDDAGNVLSIGTDSGAMLTADAIKDVVGEMVASATDGIDYDALAKVLTAKIKSLAVTDSSTIDFSVVDNNGDENITGEVKISGSPKNVLKVTGAGLYVTNLYTDDGTLKSNRTVTMDGKTLTFRGSNFPSVKVESIDNNGGGWTVASAVGWSSFYQAGTAWGIWSEVTKKDTLLYSPDTDTIILGNAYNGVRTNLWVKRDLRDYNGNKGSLGQVLMPRDKGDGTVEGIVWTDKFQNKQKQQAITDAQIKTVISAEDFVGDTNADVTYNDATVFYSQTEDETTISVRFRLSFGRNKLSDDIATQGFKCRVNPSAIARLIGEEFYDKPKSRYEVGTSYYWLTTQGGENGDQSRRHTFVEFINKNRVDVSQPDTLPLSDIIHANKMYFTVTVTSIKV